APPAVATCNAGGFTIVSSSIRVTWSLGRPLPARMCCVAPVAGFQSVRPLLWVASTNRPSGNASMSQIAFVSMPICWTGSKYLNCLPSKEARPYDGFESVVALAHHDFPSGVTVTALIETTSPSSGIWNTGGVPLPGEHEVVTQA